MNEIPEKTKFVRRFKYFFLLLRLTLYKVAKCIGK